MCSSLGDFAEITNCTFQNVNVVCAIALGSLRDHLPFYPVIWLRSEGDLYVLKQILSSFPIIDQPASAAVTDPQGSGTSCTRHQVFLRGALNAGSVNGVWKFVERLDELSI